LNIFEKSNQLAELQAEWFNYRSNLYPKFVTSNSVNSTPEDIPIFSFHNITSEDILQKLNYLAMNGYSAINSDEYLYLKGKSNGERLVMLTFDDGLNSLWSVVYPLLEAYKMKAVAFVLPGEVETQAEVRAKEGLPMDVAQLCSWPQLQAMRDVVDIQSHSLYHWLIFTKPVISSFFTPQIKSRWQKIDWPMPRIDGIDSPSREYRLGSPIYKTDSRLSDSPRVYENQSVVDACVSFVEKNGGEEFFKSKGWFKALTMAHQDAMVGHSLEMESPEVRNDSIRDCIVRSKVILDQKLNKDVKHFCFPFGIGSQHAEEIVLEAGYQAVYYGVKANFNIQDRGGEGRVARITRIKDDYLYRLPGEGRKSLMKIFYEKARRRILSTFLGKGGIR